MQCYSVSPCDFSSDRTIRYVRVLLLLFAAFTLPFVSKLVRADEPAPVNNSEWKVRVNAGGISRYVAGRWGMTKAVASNAGTSIQSGLVVVTPPGSEGLQYAK